MSTPLDYGNITLAQKFDTILDQYQRQVAVISPEQQLTYQQLNEQATQVAEHLQQLEPKRQCRGQDNRQDNRQDSQLIGLHVELSIEAIIGLWGIIKAGGAFVPLDPAYPPDRLQHILDDTQLSVILTTQAGADMLPDHQAKLLLLDDLPLSGLSTTSPSVTGSSVAGSSVAGSSQPTEDIHAVHPQDLACCLYTSGSTGKPKGVMIEHQALVKQFDNLQHHYQLTTDDRVLQFALLTHIAGVEQVIMALLSGAALVIPGQKLWTASEFLPKVQQYGLTMVDLPASYYQALAQEWAANHVTIQDTPLRLLIVGGEVTSSEGVALWSQIAASHVRFLNVYGMTEVSGTATIFEVPNNVNPDWQSLPIGQPLPNRSAYLLDDQGQPIQFEQPPYSESGELYLGGDSLARGYLNQPALTADKFIDNPFSEGKLYQTGDLARFLPKSILEYIGRKDNQVQIRGFRVELGEVETALQRHPLVEKAAVLAIGEAANKQLLAYLTLAQQTTVDNTPALDTPALDAPVINRAMLRQELSQTLPYYMVPQQYLVVETFPLTANGKIDRQALRTLDVVALPQNNQHDTFVPPATQWEQTLAEIIMAQLELDAVDVQTNFADLGLNSLHLTQLQNQIQTTFEQDIALVEIFNHPTIQALALHLSASDRLSVAKDQATGKQSRLPQTAAQAGGADRAANQRAYLQQRKRQQSKKHTRRRA